MYLGSTLNFLAHAVQHQSIAGLLLTAVVYTVYIVYSIWLENPYTAWIYSDEGRAYEEKRIAAEEGKLYKPSAPTSPKRSNKKKAE